MAIYDASSSDTKDPGCFASGGEINEIIRVDRTGQPGRDGIEGTSHHRPPGSSGQDGFRGGDATEPTDGQPARSVVCHLSYDRDHSRDQIRVECLPNQASSLGREWVSGNPTRADALPRPLVSPIGDSGYVFVDTRGGAAGHGARGGDGGPGAEGYRGRNATRFSRGTNGGPGGDGGDAGNPTHGARGGDGGDITLRVDQRNLGLLMLAKGNLSGGDLGFAGESGTGGAGGAGGPGGSSYHWTETRTYRDSKGNTRTRTVMRSNPGGVSGPDGRKGRDSRLVARDGSPGDPGRLQIEVIQADGGSTHHPSPYDLGLVSFDIASEYSILEPDSMVSIDNLVIRNRGGMSTPANYTIRVFIVGDEWLLVDGFELVMHRALAPGQTHCFDRCGLRLRLGDYVVDQPRKRPFRLRHLISPVAAMESGIARPFRNFENSETVHIRFPIELTPIACLNSLAPGESTRLIWAVRNTSQETFDHRYLVRAARTRLRILGGDLDPNALVFFDSEDQPYPIEGRDYENTLGKLGPGESTVIETRVGVKDVPEAMPYQGFVVGADLDLQRPGTSFESEQFRRVDYRKTFIRVSERYRRDAESRFLLIANQKTNTTDIEKWTQLADYFGSGLDVWDVSYYGFLDLMRVVDEDESLLDQWRGMTMIIPNNYFTTPEGKTVAFEQLAKGQFLRAAADHDINFYIVGDSRTGGADRLAQSLIPVDGAKTPSQLKTQREFLKAVKRWNRYVARSQNVVGGVTGISQDLADVSLGSVHQFAIDKRTWLFQPDPKWLEAEARRLQRKLSKHDPLHRWIIVHRYDTGDTDTSWGFFRRRQVGTLEARRTLDATKGSAVLFEVDGIDAIDREFINSEANKHGIFLALKFGDKVDRFIRLVSERTFPRFHENYVERPLTDDEVRQIGGELVDSILTDLYNEQAGARNCRTWGRWGIRGLMPKLNYLAERSLNYGVTDKQMRDNPTTMALLFDLLGNLHHMAHQSRTIWDHAVFPTAFFKRSRAVSAYMMERTQRITTNIFGNAPSWWDRMTSSSDDYDPFGFARKKAPRGITRMTANAEIEKRVDQLAQDKVPVNSYAAAQDHEGLTYDPELLTESARVLSGEQFDRLAMAEKSAAARRTATEMAIRSERADMLVPLERATEVRSTAMSTAKPTATAQR